MTEPGSCAAQCRMVRSPIKFHPTLGDVRKLFWPGGLSVVTPWTVAMDCGTMAVNGRPNTFFLRNVMIQALQKLQEAEARAIHNASFLISEF